MGAMDLQKTIQDLYAEKEKLERVIASLEELQRAADANSQVMGRSKRRGRKSMGSEERQEVSERITGEQRDKYIFSLIKEITDLIVQPPAQIETHFQKMLSCYMG